MKKVFAMLFVFSCAFSFAKKGSLEIFSEFAGKLYFDGDFIGSIRKNGRLFLDGIEEGEFVVELQTKKGSSFKSIKFQDGAKKVFEITSTDNGVYWKGMAKKNPFAEFGEKSFVGCSGKFHEGERVSVRNEATGATVDVDIVGSTDLPGVIVVLSPAAAEKLQIEDLDEQTANIVTVRRKFFWQEKI